MTGKNEKWQAVMQNNSSYDGRFYYAVNTTGIYCRPSCKSKLPKEQNVVYFDTPQDAAAAGYRPCKRCCPQLLDGQQKADIADRMKAVIDAHGGARPALAKEVEKMGVSQRRMTAVFKAQYGVTPVEYADYLRIQAAKERLRQSGEPVLEIALFLGFESLSAFYSFFYKHTQRTPAEYRKGQPVLEEGQFFWRAYETALGWLTIAAEDRAVTAIRFGKTHFALGQNQPSRLTDLAANQLEEYAAGRRKQFELPLEPAGTAFQKTVWQALIRIPYGETRSYKQIAEQVGNPAASRAVGMANNKNPIPIVIPCHRVVGANGSLVGYAGGLPFKQKLLDLEMQHPQRQLL